MPCTVSCLLSQDNLYKDFNLNAWTVRIASRIDPWQSQQLRSLQLPDTFLQPRTWRIYPGGMQASQILGFVRQDDQNSVGVYGIESQYDTLLAGKPGSFTAETDLNGNPLVAGASVEQPAVNGANLTLTIDSTMQYMVQTALAGKANAGPEWHSHCSQCTHRCSRGHGWRANLRSQPVR